MNPRIYARICTLVCALSLFVSTASAQTSQPSAPPADTPEAAETATQTDALPSGATGVPSGFDVLLHVDGMVCQFCASGIERLMGREDNVAEFEVRFDEGAVVVKVVDGATMSDEDFERIIRRAGYTLSSLERAE